MQPLDVAVFAPMKRKWREVLSVWKEKMMKENRSYAALPKQEFPTLLSQLMEKNYAESIRKGFETTGLFPLSLEKALSKLPQEEREIESAVQLQVLKKLESMRYEQPATSAATRPRQKDKLPAGASYTCLPGQQGEIGLPVQVDEEEEMEQVDMLGAACSGGDGDDSDGRTEEDRNIISRIVERMERTSKRPVSKKGFQENSSGSSSSSENEEEDEDEEDEDEDKEDNNKQRGSQTAEDENEKEEAFRTGSYVVAVYQVEIFL
jgi:hypothetical protein